MLFPATRRKAQPAREIFPPSHRGWLEKQDRGAQFEAEFAEWLKVVGRFEEVATRELYSNQNFSDVDLRYHRGQLCAVISDGEMIALEALELALQGTVEQEHLAAHLAIIDKHLAKLTARMHEWHGTVEAQADIPASVKEAFREADAGEVIPFPE